MWPNLQFPADLVAFTEEIPNGKHHFLSSVSDLKNTKQFNPSHANFPFMYPLENFWSENF